MFILFYDGLIITDENHKINILKRFVLFSRIRIKKMTEPEIYDENKVVNTWEDCVDNEDLMRGIYAYGFEAPSAIQKKAIYPIGKCRRDIIAQAQSGTGKTGAFTIGALSVIDSTLNETQALFLAPTHELANQSMMVCSAIGAHLPNFCAKTFIGGTSVMDDRVSIETKVPQAVVGCPGRIFDLIRRRILNVSKLRIIVIDEADEMLSKGFQEQIQNIFKMLPNEVQVAIFSATLTQEVLDLTPKFMRDPVRIVLEADKLTLAGIRQYYLAVKTDDEKFDALKKLLSLVSIQKCMIYCNSVNRVSQLCDAMREDGFVVDCIHRNMSKSERETTLKEFRSGPTRFLISSNITARGIDIQQVNVVINFDITQDPHTYLHRIGRSGRWGRKGTAINFITPRDIRTIRDFEYYYKTMIDPLPDNVQL
jgi:translation initiation factor 4A